MHRVSTSGSLMGGGCLQESSHWGSLPRQGQDSPTFRKIIILLRAICLVPCSTKSSLYTVRNIVNAANLHHVITYKRLNARENNKNVSTQKWLWLLTGGGRLWESSSVRLWERKVWCFGSGGHLCKVVTHGGSTVLSCLLSSVSGLCPIGCQWPFTPYFFALEWLGNVSFFHKKTSAKSFVGDNKELS